MDSFEADVGVFWTEGTQVTTEEIYPWVSTDLYYINAEELRRGNRHYYFLLTKAIYPSEIHRTYGQDEYGLTGDYLHSTEISIHSKCAIFSDITERYSGSLPRTYVNDALEKYLDEQGVSRSDFASNRRFSEADIVTDVLREDGSVNDSINFISEDSGGKNTIKCVRFGPPMSAGVAAIEVATNKGEEPNLAAEVTYNHPVGNISFTQEISWKQKYRSSDVHARIEDMNYRTEIQPDSPYYPDREVRSKNHEKVYEIY